MLICKISELLWNARIIDKFHLLQHSFNFLLDIILNILILLSKSSICNFIVCSLCICLYYLYHPFVKHAIIGYQFLTGQLLVPHTSNHNWYPISSSLSYLLSTLLIWLMYMWLITHQTHVTTRNIVPREILHDTECNKFGPFCMTSTTRFCLLSGLEQCEIKVSCLRRPHITGIWT